MREELARAVLRDARQRGHEHVELRHDGPHTIFCCTLCETRCYSDAALGDHLNGNRHKRRVNVLRASGAAVREQEPQRVFNVGQEQQPYSVTSSAGVGVGTSTTSSTTSLQWIGSGQLSLKTNSTGTVPVVEASWFTWQGMFKPVELNWHEENAGRMEYAMVVFPYSDKIGRAGDWTSLKSPSDEKGSPAVEDKYTSSDAQNSPWQVSREIIVSTVPPFSLSSDKIPTPLTITIRTKPSESISDDMSDMDVEPAKQSAFRRGWKRKLAKNIDRVCFICHQKLLPGKDVAALVNVKSGQMVCGSRNKRGVFHVFHSFCLIEWIAFCEAKAWSAPFAVKGNKRPRKIKQTGGCEPVDSVASQENGGAKSEIGEGRGIFCPECQGTGVKLKGGQLERPRFRLAQVFDWILELIQARQAWMNNPVQQVNALGLLFVTPENSNSQGVVQSQGFIHVYSGGSSRDLTAHTINSGNQLIGFGSQRSLHMQMKPHKTATIYGRKAQESYVFSTTDADLK